MFTRRGHIVFDDLGYEEPLALTGALLIDRPGEEMGDCQHVMIGGRSCRGLRVADDLTHFVFDYAPCRFLYLSRHVAVDRDVDRQIPHGLVTTRTERVEIDTHMLRVGACGKTAGSINGTPWRGLMKQRRQPL